MPTTEYYSTLKRNEVLTHAATGMRLEDVLLSEIGQTEKKRYYMIPLHKGPRIVGFTEAERKQRLPGAGRRAA